MSIFVKLASLPKYDYLNGPNWFQEKWISFWSELQAQYESINRMILKECLKMALQPKKP